MNATNFQADAGILFSAATSNTLAAREIRNKRDRFANLKTGSIVYAKACASCHGPNGLGNGRLAAAMAAYGGRPSNLTDTDWQHGASDGEIFLAIRDGIGPDFHMPLFKGKLTDEEIWHVVNYVRTLGS